MEIRYFAQMESPLGLLTFVASAKGLKAVELPVGGGTCDSKDIKYRRYVKDEKMLSPYLDQMEEYFLKKRTTFTLPLDINVTPFQSRVYRALQEIPYGSICSYQGIAKAIERPSAARAVGGANNKNPIPIIIPCHRVIASDGSLSGYRGGTDKKKKLLQWEGYF